MDRNSCFVNCKNFQFFKLKIGGVHELVRLFFKKKKNCSEAEIKASARANIEKFTSTTQFLKKLRTKKGSQQGRQCLTLLW